MSDEYVYTGIFLNHEDEEQILKLRSTPWVDINPMGSKWGPTSKPTKMPPVIVETQRLAKEIYNLPDRGEDGYALIGTLGSLEFVYRN